MASRGSSRHSRALKKLRPYLIKELPEPVELLDNSELRTKFSGYERSHIIAPSCQSQRAEKFLEVMEFAPQEVFEIFMTVLRTMKPDLGMRLKDTLKNMEIFSGAPSSPQQGTGRANASSCEFFLFYFCFCMWWINSQAMPFIENLVSATFHYFFWQKRVEI